MVEITSAGVKYKEPLLLFRQEAGVLHNISSEAGPVFAKSFASRGLAIGDFDNDGRIDVLVGINGGAPLLLKNNSGKETIGLALSSRASIASVMQWDPALLGRLPFPVKPD